MTTDKRSVAELVEIAYQMGIKDVVLSPGSRNAPLIIAFVESAKFNCYTIADERVAAFFALGLSIKSKRPTVISCTSGSAVLNYAPAISEAYYQGVPLLVLTADRPEEWIDQGIGQCIRQNNIYSNYIKAEFQFIQEASQEEDLQHNRSIVQDAIQIASSGFKGPVHINIPLAEPLYGRAEFPGVELEEKNVGIAQSSLDEGLARIWQESKRKLILMGLAPSDEVLNSLMANLHSKDEIVVLTETSSNCFVEGAIQTIDRFITGIEKAPSEYIPDLVVTLGGPVVSKKIKSLFLNNKPQHHWHVSLDAAKDTFKALTEHVQMEATGFLNSVSGISSPNATDFQKLWREGNRSLKKPHAEYLSDCPWSDLKAFDRILDSIPDGSVLHMGNSTVVRYVQLFDQNPNIEYLSNRGVSGIDGCTSTAMGYAWDSDAPNVLITGDIAFHYDSNAFWHKYRSSNLKIIVINNGGGSIFRIIPGPSSTDQLEEYFETEQNSSAELLAKHYNIEYASADSLESVNRELNSLFESSSSRILEVFTPNKLNAEVLKEYFRSIHENK